MIVSLKNIASNKVIELAITNYVKNDISIKSSTTDSIDVVNHDFISTPITLPTKRHVDNQLNKKIRRNNRARRSINENPDIIRKEL